MSTKLFTQMLSSTFVSYQFTIDSAVCLIWKSTIIWLLANWYQHLIENLTRMIEILKSGKGSRRAEWIIYTCGCRGEIWVLYIFRTISDYFSNHQFDHSPSTSKATDLSKFVFTSTSLRRMIWCFIVHYIKYSKFNLKKQYLLINCQL